jgi:hypothetical protein
MSGHNRKFRVSRTAMRVLGGTAALVALPWIVFAPPATASPCYGDCQPGVARVGAGILRYDAPAGADDQITITAGTAFFTLTDTTATFSAGSGCTMVSPHEAHCTSVFALRVRGLDGNDVITNNTGANADLHGGTGDDRLIGGSADDRLIGEFGADVLMGGGGSDTASYADTSIRAGVRADLDGATGDDGGPEDGPPGARDTIGADVENLEGSSHGDVLIGNAGPNIITNGMGDGTDQIQGLGGDDQLSGRGGGTVDGGTGADHCTSDIRGLPKEPDTFVGCEATEILN